ncbi:hypothetical protein ACMFMG_004211 [Clarireedia jacksonii]
MQLPIVVLLSLTGAHLSSALPIANFEQTTTIATEAGPLPGGFTGETSESLHLARDNRIVGGLLNGLGLAKRDVGSEVEQTTTIATEAGPLPGGYTGETSESLHLARDNRIVGGLLSTLGLAKRDSDAEVDSAARLRSGLPLVGGLLDGLPLVGGILAKRDVGSEVKQTTTIATEAGPLLGGFTGETSESLHLAHDKRIVGGLLSALGLAKRDSTLLDNML